ncbi:MOP flippase family protein [Maribacter arcticus]|uniref:Lipopolysaccharide exporter n=1 Tax=Maribacter arcticus TaxID=561365 RepID=A0A1T5BVN3_9FLAO|nr:MOP flippase family protein [Maribacter arcticus]SKB51043.1 lipopolysaccharide exporter [Maribacter arcticus]
MDTPNNKSKIVSGIKWTTIGTIVIALTALLKISILTRFLDKSDFGLMALIMFVLGFTDLFTDMGLTSAILHKQNISKKEYASLYWFNIGFSLLLYVMLFFISPFIAGFYEEPRLVTLIPLLGLNILASAVGRIFKTMEAKDLQFKYISIFEIFSAALSLILAVILAINNFGILSLVYSALLQYALQNLLYFIYGFKKYGLLFHYRFNETKAFLKIGIYQVGGQVINYFNRDLDILIIGKAFGQDVLGGYSLAKQLVYRPTQILNPIFTKVAGPVLAKLQFDLVELKRNYLKFLNYVMSVNIPVYLILIIFAPLIVEVFYGSGYENIVLLVRILSVYMLFRAIGNPIGSLVIATGRTDIEFYWNLISLFVLPGAIIIGSLYSIEAVAIAMTISMLILLVPSWYFLVYKLTGATLKEYLNSFLPKFNFKEVYKNLK